MASGAFAETDRFVEREQIGRGGMGLVIRALDKDLEREVAIKVLPVEWADSVEARRFVQEARITGRLEHPSIVPVYELGSDQRGARYLSMKLVQGETLDDALARAGALRLSPEHLADLLQVFVKLCDAVSFAHSQGIIHRDLKPSNVMIGDFGEVYVMDWGVALDTRHRSEEDSDPPGALIGTPCYMAPEQLRGMHDLIGERTDVFGLGATLYQILTGRPPHEGVSALLRRGGPLEIDPPEKVTLVPTVPAELSRIAMKAMAVDPAHRYASVTELKSDIQRFERGAWHLPQTKFAAGTVILREGEPGDSAHIIVEGKCVAFSSDGAKEIILREMGPGDVFGETAVFSNKPRSASVKAVTDVVLIVVTKSALSNALGLNMWMGTFVKALADRFRDVDERLRQLEQGERRDSEG